MYSIARSASRSSNNIVYHIEAILTSMIWGITFVSTKVLMSAGLSPQEIMLLRFILAYVCIWTICPRRLWADNIKDELLLVVLGMTGGSFYFLAENIALQYTQACNVSILLSIIPLLTALATPLFFKSQHITKPLLFGALIALLGVVFVVLNEHTALKLSPIGDMLTILASTMWVAYGLILKKLQQRGYTSEFITRKVFFYGIVTIIPCFPLLGSGIHLAVLGNINVLFNLCFLGIVASFLCYLSWNRVIDKIGVVAANNYLYLSPLATFVVSSIVLQERITSVAIMGSFFILLGVYFSQKTSSRNGNEPSSVPRH
jgi:drug/metabolite transporter (DMT)-like permease